VNADADGVRDLDFDVVAAGVERRLVRLTAHCHADWLAPLSDSPVVQPEDGRVSPLRRRRWERRAVDVAGRGVIREKDSAPSISAIHPQLDHVQVIDVAAPTPVSLHRFAADRYVKYRLHRGEIWRRPLLRSQGRAESSAGVYGRSVESFRGSEGLQGSGASLPDRR
jgi:hypothetical protein